MLYKVCSGTWNWSMWRSEVLLDLQGWSAMTFRCPSTSGLDKAQYTPAMNCGARSIKRAAGEGDQAKLCG